MAEWFGVRSPKTQSVSFFSAAVEAVFLAIRFYGQGDASPKVVLER
jgi:hypothetical protein